MKKIVIFLLILAFAWLAGGVGYIIGFRMGAEHVVRAMAAE